MRQRSTSLHKLKTYLHLLMPTLMKPPSFASLIELNDTTPRGSEQLIREPNYELRLFFVPTSRICIPVHSEASAGGIRNSFVFCCGRIAKITKLLRGTSSENRRKNAAYLFGGATTTSGRWKTGFVIKIKL